MTDQAQEEQQGVKRHPKGKGCWYYTHIEECVLCGVTDTYRERRWGKKPERPEDRYGYEQFACGEHFI